MILFFYGMKTFFNISCTAGQLETRDLVFVSENIIILSFFLQDIFATFRILGGQYIFLQHFKCIISIVWAKKKISYHLYYCF